jgi:hypothetical protein
MNKNHNPKPTSEDEKFEVILLLKNWVVHQRIARCVFK